MALILQLGPEGDKKLIRKLKRLGNKFSKKYVRVALREIAQDQAKEIKPLIPKDAGVVVTTRTGKQRRKHLRQTVRVRAIKPSAASKKKRQGEFGSAVLVGDKDLFSYAAHVELGTSKQQSQPFMREPLDRLRPRFEKVVATKIWPQIKREARR